MKSKTNQLTGLWLLLFSLFILVSCRKDDKLQVKQTDTYSSEVVVKWIEMKTRIFLSSDPSQRPGYDRTLTVRFYAYLGIALYEAVMPGMPNYRSLSGQLTDMPGMPQIEAGKQYHWPAAAMRRWLLCIKACYTVPRQQLKW